MKIVKRMVKKEPWSKRVWYVAALVALLTLWSGNPLIILFLNIISLIIITIISISLKIKESNVLVQPSTSLHHSQDSPTQEYVSLNGVQYRVQSNSLDLKNKGIKNLLDIEGFDKLWYLKKLDLSNNQISSMKGLEPFINLRVLKLSNNQIQNIEYISMLSKLQVLLLDNNQIKEFRQSDLPQESILKKIDISKNPIEKFDILMVHIYKAIKFGPKEWFPKPELKRLSKQIRRIKRGGTVKELFMKFLVYFAIWAVLAIVLALVINLPFWGVITTSTALEMNYWQFLFSQGLWTFLVGGIGAIFVMVIFYEGVVL